MRARRALRARREACSGDLEPIVLLVGHALCVRYVVDAAPGSRRLALMSPIAHAAPHRLARASVETAVERLEAWSHAPRFRDVPGNG